MQPRRGYELVNSESGVRSAGRRLRSLLAGGLVGDDGRLAGRLVGDDGRLADRPVGDDGRVADGPAAGRRGRSRGWPAGR